jgi:hypothetical protein
MNIPCPDCNGLGIVTPEFIERYTRGLDFKSYRERLGLGLREAADKWGIKASMLSDIEWGRIEIPHWTPPGYSEQPSPWQDGKTNQQHLEECPDDDCVRCNHLIDGFYMACDSCGHWGLQESDGWVLAEGIPFCSVECARERFGESVEIQ